MISDRLYNIIIILTTLIFNQDDHFVPCFMKDRVIDARPLHNCSTKRSTKITGIDEDGNYHDLNTVK